MEGCNTAIEYQSSSFSLSDSELHPREEADFHGVVGAGLSRVARVPSEHAGQLCRKLTAAAADRRNTVIARPGPGSSEDSLFDILRSREEQGIIL